MRYSALLLLCLALTCSEAVRTHDQLVAHNTYHGIDWSRKDVQSAASAENPVQPVENPDVDHDYVGIEAQQEITSASDSPAPENSWPHLVHSDEDNRSTTPHTASTTQVGDFMPDARPWWISPQYASYGNYRQGLNLRKHKVHNQHVISQDKCPPASYRTSKNHRFHSLTNCGSKHPSSLSEQGQINGQLSSSDLRWDNFFSRPGRFRQYSSRTSFKQIGGGCPTRYWIRNTERWPAFFDVKSTIGEALGTPATRVFGETTIMQGLLNTRPDGYSSLLRSGATAILNSYSRTHYRFSHLQVIEAFAVALVSSEAAAQQAASFEEATLSANSCA